MPEITLTPVADTFITRGDSGTNYSDQNYGSLGRLSMGRYFDAHLKNDALLRFSLDDVPSGASIVSAMLLLYLYRANKRRSGRQTVTIKFHPATQDWSESTVTWNTRPTLDTSIESSTYSASFGSSSSGEQTYHYDNVPRTWDVTEIVKYWLDQGQPNYGICSDANGGAELWFRSREYGDPAFRPVLVITYSRAPDKATDLSPGGPDTSPALINTLSPGLSWTYVSPDDDTQGAYQVEVEDVTASTIVYDSGKIDSPTQGLNLPAVLEWGETYRWRVKAWSEHDIEGEWSEWVYFETLGAPLAPTPTDPPDGVGMDATDTIRFAWIHRDPEGYAQVKHEIEIRDELDNVVYNEEEATSDEFHDLPANSLINGQTYYWRVRTWNAIVNVPGDWSPPRMLRASKPPTVAITAPSAGDYDKGIVAAEWTFADPDGDPQAWYRAQLLKDGQVIEDSGQVPGTATSHAFAAVLENEAAYTIKVAAANPWKQADEDSVAFTTDFTPPVAPALSLEEKDGFIRLSWQNPDDDQNKPATDRVDLWRRETGGQWLRIAKGLEPNAFYDDYATASGVQYEYKAVGISVNETPADSNTETGSIAFKGVWLHAVDEPAATAHRYQYDGRGRSDEWHPTVALRQFAGRQYPVAEFGESAEEPINVTLQTLRGSDDLVRLRALARRKAIICYRDDRGRKVFGVMLGLSSSDEVYGAVSQFTLHRVDYKEDA